MTDKRSESSPSPIRALVCGFEKSGTTMINEILRRHPALDSGFECGLLLGDSPRDFRSHQPYYAWFRKKWGLRREDMHFICDTDNWLEAYRRIRERAPIIEDKSVSLFDKTPIYMQQLDSVLSRIAEIPCIVNVRDPRALMLSWARWSGHRDEEEDYLRQTLPQQVERYLSYGRGYRSALTRHAQRILLSRFEELCLDPETKVSGLFEFLGLEFKPDYLRFDSEFFVYGNTVSTEYLTPYRGVLSEGLCEEILAGTSEFSEWHWPE